MYRELYEQLLKWKNGTHRKPLIINGARQVGKTYLLKEFGKTEYEKVSYVSLDRNEKAREVFERGGQTDRLFTALSAITGVDITAGDTLLILDEIQDCPRALQALKYFCEDAPEIHVAVAGSLLGVSLHEGVSFPVGKVDELRLYPMDFQEFLIAVGKQRLADILTDGDWEMANMLFTEYTDLLRLYYYVGGMPAAVLAYIEGNGLNAVRCVQRQILADYRRDFSKHAPVNEVPRINMVWDSIPSQLARENKKFTYGTLKKGARAAEYEKALQWLQDAGIVYRVKRVSKLQMPLKFYEEQSAFKLFMLDVGLFGAMTDTSAGSMIVDNKVFTEYKGAFSELFVYTQLCTCNIPIYYHSIDKSTIEIDFLLQCNDRIIPVEVKAGVNVKSKSMKTVISNNPQLKGMRFSMLPYIDQQWMENVPLFACKAMFGVREK